MRRNKSVKDDVTSRINDMLRIADSRDGMDLKRLSTLSGICYDTLASYRDRPSRPAAAMPLHIFVAIAPHISDDLLSLCTEPGGKHVATNEHGDGDLDALGVEAAGYVADKLEREADGVVCHIDKAALQQRARKIVSTARAAAA